MNLLNRTKIRNETLLTFKEASNSLPFAIQNSRKSIAYNYKIYGNEKGLSEKIFIETKGKNLFDMVKKFDEIDSRYAPQTGTVSTTHILLDNNTYQFTYLRNLPYIAIPIEVEANTDYCITFTFNKNMKKGGNLGIGYSNTNPDTYYLKSWGFGSADGFESDYTKSLAFNSGEYTTVYLRGYLSWGRDEGYVFNLKNIQLEKGTTPTSYEPFKEPITTTIDLTGYNSVMPNDYLDFRNGCIMRSDGTEEEIYLPKLHLSNGTNIIDAYDNTSKADKMYIKY